VLHGVPAIHILVVLGTLYRLRAANINDMTYEKIIEQ